MALKFQIGEIAHFFDIPASTLRYWEDKGVLHPEKGIENRYREYTIEDFMTISDVVFYKNLGLQLKEIREMDGSSPEQHGKLFTEKLSELEQQQVLSEKDLCVCYTAKKVTYRSFPQWEIMAFVAFCLEEFAFALQEKYNRISRKARGPCTSTFVDLIRLFLPKISKMPYRRI